MTLNELIKLMRLWTTGPWFFFGFFLFLCFNPAGWPSTLTLSILSFQSGLFHLWIWTHPLMQIGKSVKNINRTANSVHPDEPSHQDNHCLHRSVLAFRDKRVKMQWGWFPFPWLYYDQHGSYNYLSLFSSSSLSLSGRKLVSTSGFLPKGRKQLYLKCELYRIRSNYRTYP